MPTSKINPEVFITLHMWRTEILLQTRKSLINITERAVCIKDVRCWTETNWWPSECFRIELTVQLFSLAVLPLSAREGPKHQMYFVEDSSPPLEEDYRADRGDEESISQLEKRDNRAAWEKTGRQHPNAQEPSNIDIADSDTLRGQRADGLSLWDLMLELQKSNSFHPLAGFIWDLGFCQTMVNTWYFSLPFQEWVWLACSITLGSLCWEMLPRSEWVFNCPQIPGRLLRCLLAGAGHAWRKMENQILLLPCARPLLVSRRLCSLDPLSQVLLMRVQFTADFCVGGSAQRRVILTQTQSQTALLSQGWGEDKINYD